MTIHQVTRVLDVKAELGECPLWCVDDQCLYWLDIMGRTINRFDPQSGQNSVWSLPAVPGCFAFRDGGGAIIAAQDGFYDITFATGRIDRVCGSPYDPKRLRFNDGRTDRQGRLWVGTVRADVDVDNAENAYYRFDGRRVDKMIPSIGVANGTAFSLDSKTMYRAHTLDRRIFAYDFDAVTGNPSRERVFVEVPSDLGMPDGATVDTESAYWVALIATSQGGKAGVARYMPDGRLDVFIEVPVPLPTMVAFGGSDMSTLFITSGRLEEWVNYKVPEAAGSIFAAQTNFRGVPETKFRYA